MTTRHRYERFTQIRTRVTALDLPDAAADLDWCDTRFTQAARRMQDARAGLPGAQAYDAPTVTGGSSGSPVERGAVGRTCVRCDEPDACGCARSVPGDRTQPDRELLDLLLNRLWYDVRPTTLHTEPDKVRARVARDCLTLRRLIEAWSAHQPTPRDKRQVEAANAAPVDCEHHATAGIFEPVAHTGTVSGNLDLPMRLCSYCYWQVKRKGKLPSGEAMERRKRTGKDEKEKV